jgi:transmembrane sensor
VRLDFSATRLADAVAQVNHYNRDQIVIEDPSLADLRVSGIVSSDRLDGFLRLVELMDVRAERRPSGEIVLRRAP